MGFTAHTSDACPRSSSPPMHPTLCGIAESTQPAHHPSTHRLQHTLRVHLTPSTPVPARYPCVSLYNPCTCFELTTPLVRPWPPYKLLGRSPPARSRTPDTASSPRTASPPARRRPSSRRCSSRRRRTSPRASSLPLRQWRPCPC